MPITHQQIAEKLGVSRTLVTGALHGTRRSGISLQTQQEIERIAREMGYQPRNVTTHNIGYVLPVEKMTLEVEAAFLLHIEEALRENGYRLTLAGFNPNEPPSLSETLNPKTVDGVIFSRWHGGAIRNIVSSKIPWILTSDEDGVEEDVDLVAVDMAQTLRNVTNYLLSLGHERICLIVGYSDIKYHRMVQSGVREVLSAAGLPETNLRTIEVIGGEQIELGCNRPLAESLLAAMQQPDAPTAVIAANPGQALPALYALRTAGYRVPADVSLISVADIHQFKALRPVLTTTTAFDRHVTAQVVQRMIEKIKNPDAPPQRVLLPGEIVERESVAAAPTVSPREGNQ